MLILCLAVAVAAAGVQGYSGGAPDSVCEDMVPKHPVAPQKSAAPYTITTSAKVTARHHTSIHYIHSPTQKVWFEERNVEPSDASAALP